MKRIAFIAIAGILFLSLYSAHARKKCAWKYIVIHHSGTAAGSLKSFDVYHRSRGMENGVAYHFVIDNGTNAMKDGQVEITKRWKKQLYGGHCNKDLNNKTGIGICLVGNFQKAKPTEKQFWSLAWLVKKLMKEYDIPLKNVTGHCGMKGEQTICPGRHFPWDRLRKELKEEK